MSGVDGEEIASGFDPQHPVLVLCRHLSREMDLFDDAAAAALGVGRSDLRALNQLEHGPLTPAVIADRLGLTRAAVTSLVDRLAASHLVVRKPVATDRRTTLVELLPDTWTAFARIYRPLGERVHAAAGTLPAHEQDVLLAALQALDTAFSEARDQVRAP